MSHVQSLVVCLFLTLALTSDGLLQGMSRFPRENANQFLDTGLKLLSQKYKDPMKPIPMKPRAFGLDERIGLMNVEVLVKLENGQITRIGKVSRLGNAWMTVIPARNEDEDESTVTEATISIEDIEFNSNVIFDVMGVNHYEHIQGKIDYIGARLILATNGTTGDRSMPYMRVYELRGVDVQFVGPNEHIDQLRNIPVRMVIRIIMNTQLKLIIQQIVSNAVRGSLRGFTSN